jgi:hypothetical protein
MNDSQHNISDSAIIKVADNAGTVLSDADFAPRLEALARQIEDLERTAIFRIGLRLSEAHELFLYRRDEGGFQGWVEDRLGYSRSKAYRILDVAKLIKSVPAWDTFGTLPVTALEQIAAVSTPNQAREEILERLKIGERLTCLAVTEIISSAKQSKKNETGNIVALRDYVQSADDEPSVELPANPPTPSAKTPKARPKKKVSLQTACSDLVLEEFFGQASGTDIFDRIPSARRTEVIAAFLDQLTVEGMLQVMSPEFGQALRARLPAPKVKSSKSDKPKFKPLPMAKTTDASGQTVFTPEPRRQPFRH